MQSINFKIKYRRGEVNDLGGNYNPGRCRKDAPENSTDPAWRLETDTVSKAPGVAWG